MSCKFLACLGNTPDLWASISRVQGNILICLELQYIVRTIFVGRTCGIYYKVHIPFALLCIEKCYNFMTLNNFFVKTTPRKYTISLALCKCHHGHGQQNRRDVCGCKHTPLCSRSAHGNKIATLPCMPYLCFNNIIFFLHPINHSHYGFDGCVGTLRGCICLPQIFGFVFCSFLFQMLWIAYRGKKMLTNFGC